MRKIIIIIIMLINILIYADLDESILFKYDGANGVLFNMEYPEMSINRFSIIYGSPIDNYPYNYFTILKELNLTDTSCVTDSLFRWGVHGSLESETGELMLNQFTGEINENRDHATNLAGYFIPRNRSLKLFYTQRYIDTYSDRYDVLWREYKKEFGENMYMYGGGLINDKVIGLSLNTDVVATDISFIPYERWGVTPYFYSPIFKDGYKIKPEILFKLPIGDISLNTEFDRYSEYWNHQDPEEYTDTKLNLCWRKSFGNSAVSEVSYVLNSMLLPSWKIGCIFSGSVNSNWFVNLNANLFGNLKPDIIGKIVYSGIQQISISVEGGVDYNEKYRANKFVEHTDTVFCKNFDYYEPKCHIATVYYDTLLFPLNLRIWFDYSKRPTWESIEELENNNIEITRDTISNSNSPLNGQFGIRGSYIISTKKLVKFNLYGGFVVTPEKTNRQYSLPYDLGIDIEIGERYGTTLYAGFYFNTRAETFIKYYDVNDNEIVVFNSEPRTSLDLEARLPFYLPVFRDKLKPTLKVNVGPIRFAKEQRICEHPMGNSFGPKISIAFCANFNGAD